MIKDLIKNYYEELHELLINVNYDKYCAFVEKWHEMGVIDNKTYNAFNNGNEQTRINSYCHLILGFKGDNKVAKEWANKHLEVTTNA